MALSQRLDLRHSQSLVLTPQLQQAIKLLQLNNMELTEYVEGELAQNPLLERDDGEGPANLEAVEHDNLLRHESGDEPERVRDTAERAANETLPSTAEDPSDVDYDNNWGSAGIEESDGVAAMGAGAGELAGWRTAGSGYGGDGDEFGLEHTLSETKTLRDHLLDQMAMEIVAVAGPTGAARGKPATVFTGSAGWPARMV